ncbi:hypothetical protein [Sandarakinorhabdus sp.]|uniref:hypothetical protein n=1 Tax=Sandarakinorhabdus sp. TaxID=1916663 RepID=UPI00286E0307|nr:hypothetical protein [Sandarakinorhabdus sp.]
MIDRRTLLRAGGGLGLAVAGAGLWRAHDQGLLWSGEEPALAAWQDWNDRRYIGPLSLVSAGLLASSPHNTQPWRFAVGRFGVDVFEVPERQLGAMDPFGRERLAGLGAAVHNMALASTGLKRAARVKLLPDPAAPHHVARILLGPENSGPASHALLSVIGRRHTHRGAWIGGRIAPARQAALLAFPRPDDIQILLFDAGSAQGKRFAALTTEATAAIAGDVAMMEASHRWFRHEKSEADRFADGLTMRTSGVSPLLATLGSLLPAPSAMAEGQYWLDATRDTALPTASMFGLIVTPDPQDRRSAMLAGSAWQRLHLNATALGLVAQPLNQLPEMIDREAQLGLRARFSRLADALLPDPALRPTFAFRLGFADPALPALRRPVSAVLGPPARMAFEVAQWRVAGGSF